MNRYPVQHFDNAIDLVRFYRRMKKKNTSGASSLVVVVSIQKVSSISPTVSASSTPSTSSSSAKTSTSCRPNASVSPSSDQRSDTSRRNSAGGGGSPQANTANSSPKISRILTNNKPINDNAPSQCKFQPCKRRTLHNQFVNPFN